MSRPSALPLVLPVCLGLAGCWKPNPLFVDATGGTTQVSSGSSGSGGPMTTTDVPTTGAGPTSGSTSTTEALTGGPTGSSSGSSSGEGTTGAACVDGVITIEPADDTFLLKALDAGDACSPFVDELFGPGLCEGLDFGEQPVLSVFNEPDPLDPGEQRTGAYIVRFERDEDGRLLETLEGPAIEPVNLKSAKLKVWYQRAFDGKAYEDVAIDVYSIPAMQWIQGPGHGQPCAQPAATYKCSACAPGCTPWPGGGPIDLAELETLGTVHVTPKVAPQLLTIDIDPDYFGVHPSEGLLLIPDGGTLQGAETTVATGALRILAREFVDVEYRPTLEVVRCAP